MSTVPSATAPSATPSTLWNNKNYLILAGLGIAVLSIAYYFFNRRAPVDNRPPPADLSQRLITAHFPKCANVNQMFIRGDAQGSIKINLENLGIFKSRNPFEVIFIEYVHRGKTVSQPMNMLEFEAEAYLRYLPYGEKVHLQFKYQGKVLEQHLIVSETFAIYEIYIKNGSWIAEPHPETPHKAMGQWHFDFDADNSLSLSINNSSKVEEVPSRFVTQEKYYIFENTTQKVHVLFFEIAGLTAYGDTNEQRLVVPITVFPGGIALPQGFLRTSWEHTFRTIHGREPPPNPRLTIASVLDTAAPD